MDVGRAILVELDMVSWTLFEDNDCNVDRTQHPELVGFFEKPILSLQKGDRTIAFVCDGLNLNLSSPHVLSVCRIGA